METHEYVLKRGGTAEVSNQGDSVRGKGGVDRFLNTSPDQFLDTYLIWIKCRMPDWERKGSETRVVLNRLPDRSEELTGSRSQLHTFKQDWNRGRNTRILEIHEET